MANFRYNRSSGHLEPVSQEGGGDRTAQIPTRTTFMVMKEGRLVFEGTQAELEASTDAYIASSFHNTQLMASRPKSNWANLKVGILALGAMLILTILDFPDHRQHQLSSNPRRPFIPT